MNKSGIGLVGPEPAFIRPAHPLEDCACLQLRMASRAISRFFDKILEPSGLKATQFSFLVAIDDAVTPSVSDLAADLVMDQSTVARNLKPLEKAGLIMTLVVQDRRCKKVGLTRKGELKLAAAMPLWSRAQETLQDLLGADMLSANGYNLKLFVHCVSEQTKSLAANSEA